MAKQPNWKAQAEAFHESLDDWFEKGVVQSHLEKEWESVREFKTYLADYITFRQSEIDFYFRWKPQSPTTQFLEQDVDVTMRLLQHLRKCG